MQFRNSEQNYGIIEKLLHWSLALLVIIMVSGSFFFDDLPEDIKHSMVNLHKLTGMLIFILAILFLLWKHFNIKPPLPTNMPRWQVILAKSVHHVLLLAVILMPLVGWIMVTAGGKLPHIGAITFAFPGIPESKAIKSFCWEVHKILAWVIIGILSLHIVGALKHALIDRDGVLRRMWF